MENVGEGNRFAPPQAVVADVPVGGSTVLAGRWRRLGGAILDALLVGLAAWIIALVTRWNIISNDSSWQVMTRFDMRQASGFLLLMAINGYLLATQGKTVAKVMLGMRIVRVDGSAASFPRLLVREGAGYFFSFVPAIGFLYYLVDCLMIFRSSRRCLHDEIADTMVVRG